MLTKNLDFRTLYMLYNFFTNLDNETKRYFHPPLVYPLYKSPFSLISYVRLFISSLIPIYVLVKAFPRLACITAIAKSNGIQGFAQLTMRRNLKWYESELSIVVGGEFQGKGIGNMLLKTVIGEGRRNNVVKIRLGVLKENIPAISLYRKHGFRIVKETVDSFNGIAIAALLMESSLATLD